MSDTFFELYRSKVFELAKTMVIKFDPAAVTINNELNLLGHLTDQYDKTTWKYYQNLAGIYHTTDTMMTIPSLDQTGVTLDFTIDNLNANRITKSEYYFGSRFYKRLVEKYPNQESLIMGIINPIDIQTAIDAKDGVIIFHDTSLVEDNETNLISNLESWIGNFLARWHIKDYALPDNLYLATMLGILYINIPLTIMNIRLANAKTEQAHSYHIREYLESHGRLAKYLKFLTKKQALFLYRNIRYIHRNAGKRVTFALLVDRLLSERDLPIAEFDIRHNLGLIDVNLQPDIRMRRKAINFSHVGAGDNERELDYVIGKEALETPISTDEITRQITVTREAMIKHFGNRLPTKVLESSVVDTIDSVAYPLASILLNHWIYYASNGTYDASIALTNPSTGERFFVTAKDSIVVYIYCLMHGFLKDDDDEISDAIPQVVARLIRRDVPPVESDLLKVIDSTIVHASTVEAALAVEYFVETMNNPDDFYQACTSIQAGLMAHRDLYCKTEHNLGRAMVEYMVSLFYEDRMCDLVSTPTTFTDFFLAKGINFGTMTTEDYRLLSNKIVETVTGAGENSSKLLREMHKGMIELMKSLSSYSVQFLTTINNSSTAILDWPVQRVGDTEDEASAEEYIKPGIVEVVQDTHYHESQTDYEVFGDRGAVQQYYTSFSAKEQIDLALDLKVTSDGFSTQAIDVYMPICSVLLDDWSATPLDTAIVIDDVPDYTYPPNDFYPEAP